MTALHVDVDDDKETDYGGCYSNQISHSYEGIVALNSPPTPKVKKKKKKLLLVIDKWKLVEPKVGKRWLIIQ